MVFDGVEGEKIISDKISEHMDSDMPLKNTEHDTTRHKTQDIRPKT